MKSPGQQYQCLQTDIPEAQLMSWNRKCMLPFFTSCLQLWKCIRPSCSHISAHHFLLSQEAMSAEQSDACEAVKPDLWLEPPQSKSTKYLSFQINTAFCPQHQPTQTRMQHLSKLLEDWVCWLPPSQRRLECGRWRGSDGSLYSWRTAQVKVTGRPSLQVHYNITRL